MVLSVRGKEICEICEFLMKLAGITSTSSPMVTFWRLSVLMAPNDEHRIAFQFNVATGQLRKALASMEVTDLPMVSESNAVHEAKAAR